MKLGYYLLIFFGLSIILSFVIAIINYDNREVYDLFLMIGLVETIIENGLLYLAKRWSMIYLILFDKTTNKTFKKIFDTEFEKDKFRRKLLYSKKLIIKEDSSSNWNN